MYRNHQIKNISESKTLKVFLALLLVFLLGHVSQHDIAPGSGTDQTKCDFCLKGHSSDGLGNHAITPVFISDNIPFLVPRALKSLVSITPTFYSPRAPPRMF